MAKKNIGDIIDGISFIGVTAFIGIDTYITVIIKSINKSTVVSTSKIETTRVFIALVFTVGLDVTLIDIDTVDTIAIIS